MVFGCRICRASGNERRVGGAWHAQATFKEAALPPKRVYREPSKRIPNSFISGRFLLLLVSAVKRVRYGRKVKLGQGGVNATA